VAESKDKEPLFELEERVEMIRDVTQGLGNIDVEPFSGLVVSFARERKVTAILRGLRAVSDFEYEFQMALMNRRLAAEIETVFLMPNERYTYLNSTIVKEVARLGGDLSGLVPEGVLSELAKRFGAD
jgi:pantetheine-phosphate adenylyltransferase